MQKYIQPGQRTHDSGHEHSALIGEKFCLLLSFLRILLYLFREVCTILLIRPVNRHEKEKALRELFFFLIQLFRIKPCGTHVDQSPVFSDQCDLGDLAFLHGHPADYAVSKPLLKKLEAAGIELVFCMGNHDRRSAFDKEWPGRLAKSPVPGKYVSVTSLGTSDLVILDGLQGTDDRPLTDMGPGGAKLTPDQIAWLKKDFPKRTRPFFVASHFPVAELKVTDKREGDLGHWLIKNAPKCVGYLYGHLHRWRPEWMHGSWGKPHTLRTLCMPSGGLWGDIGYATFKTSADRAVCRLEMQDFYFPSEPDTAERPAPWRIKVEETRGQSCTFLYDREGV